MSLWSRFERRINDLADGLVLDEYRDQLNQARTLIGSGDVPTAIEVLEAVLRDKADHDEARRHLERAVVAEAPPAIAMYALGRLALAEGKPAAEQLLNARARSTEATPLDAAIRFDILVAQGDAALADKDAIRAHAFYLE